MKITRSSKVRSSRSNRSTKTASMPKPRRAARHSLPAMEWLEDVSGKTARTTAIGSRKLLVENYTGILEFSDTCIRLMTGCGSIQITGHGLYLCDVRPNALIIHGEIQRVDLPCEGRSNDEG